MRDLPAESDGYRILVNRLWPRGVSKAEAECNEWCKDIAPSSALRRAFHADEFDFDEFRARYRDELEANVDAAVAFRKLVAANAPVTLVYDSSRSPNHADVLRDWLDS